MNLYRVLAAAMKCDEKGAVPENICRNQLRKGAGQPTVMVDRVGWHSDHGLIAFSVSSHS